MRRDVYTVDLLRTPRLCLVRLIGEDQSALRHETPKRMSLTGVER